MRIRWISGVTKTPEVEIKAKISLIESLRCLRIDAIISCLAVVEFSCVRLKEIRGAHYQLMKRTNATLYMICFDKQSCFPLESKANQERLK